MMSAYQLGEISFSKIVVAIDGSEPSLDAARYAIRISGTHHASLLALYVISAVVQNDYDSDMPVEGIPGTVKKTMDDAKRESDPWFTRIRNEIRTDSSFKFHSKIILSPIKASASIVNYADNEKANLIVIGTRGRSGLKKLMLGSVASDVVTYAHCPVLVVK
jgi:nucleotide-binding universal stress UspA family protein